ncbi:polyprenol monophosphomannose synthase [bacterium]|nr:polyprenol monophosphomannose synthase [bacterium]
MKTVVTLPTYNEAENIEDIIRQILCQDDSIYVLVIDDLSPDGTGEIVDKIAEQNPRVKIIHRKGKRGRGAAGIKGFVEALKTDADLIVEMDSDFSHNPKYLPDFIKYAQDYDVVIGSRFIKGGKETGRSFLRVFVSILANTYIRLMLWFPVKDCSSGYRCFRSSLLRNINFDRFISTGPSIVSELLFHICVYNKVKIKEIPIVFEDRVKGESKLHAGILIQNLLFIVKLFLKKIDYKIRRNL